MSASTSNPESSDRVASLAREEARSLVDKILDEAPAVGFSARDVLDRHPELQQYPSCTIDLAYEEYCRARENGNPIAASEFVEAFADIQQSLYRVIEFDQVLHDHPSLVEEVPEERWPHEGDQFEGFQLLEQLGRGALSRVFRARHTKLGQKPVVVKVCIRGEREAELLGQLAHPNIGEVHSIDVDAATGLAAICMPYQTRLTMHHLAEWLCCHRESQEFRLRKKLAAKIHSYVTSISQCEDTEHVDCEISLPFHAQDDLANLVAKWGVQLASALSIAHENSVLHCDVKPGNVLVLPDLSTRLLDFNLATSEDDPSRLAGGTLPYMATEQLRVILAADARPLPDGQNRLPSQKLNNRADVFGLCATLWHMAVGRPPFGSTLDAPTRREAAEQMIQRHKAGISDIDRAYAATLLSSKLVDVLIQGMSFEPSARQQSVLTLKNQLSGQIKKNRRPLYLGLLASGLVLTSAVLLIPRFEDPSKVAYQLASEQFAKGNLDSATDTIQSYRFANDQSQILELAIRTSQLETPSHLMQALERERPFLEQWKNVVEEWKDLQRTSAYPDVCRFNAYLAQMEVKPTNLSASELLNQTFPDGSALAASYPRQVMLRDVLKRQMQEEFSNTAELVKLTDSIELATRGEFISVFEAVVKEAEKNPSEMNNELADRLLLSLRDDDAIAEPSVSRVWVQRKNWPKNKLATMAFKMLDLDNSRKYNRLGRFLRLVEPSISE